MIRTLPAALYPTVDVPDVSPDFSAPFFVGFQTIASYVLAGALIITLIALIIAIVGLAFHGFGSERMRSWAGENIIKIFIAAAALGAVNGLFGWFVNFNFGF
jgi:hypothetical protein